MRTVVEEYQVYKYDELSEEQKEKVLENYADINVDHQWWDGDWVLGLTAKEMKTHRIKASSPVWQWDDISFVVGMGYSRNRYIQFDNLWVYDEEAFRKFLMIPKSLWECCDWRFVNSNANWNTPSTKLEIESDFSLERQERYGWEFTEKQQEIIDRAIGIWDDKMSECWKMLSDEYDYQTSREAIEETIRINEWEFTSDGKIA